MSKKDTPKPNPAALSREQIKALRGLGHQLKPIVRVGRNGVTHAIIGAAMTALSDHELIKVGLNPGSQSDRRQEANDLAKAIGAHIAQVIGRTALMYRRHPNKPVIKLPGRVLQVDDIETKDETP